MYPAPVRTGVWLYPGRAAGELVEAVIAAEEEGLDEVWIADEGPARDPLSVLAAAALQTSRITLAVGITSPLLRHPGALASTAATIDELSAGDASGPGRMVLGLGLGGVESLAPFGIVADRPVAQMATAIAKCRDVLGRRRSEHYTPPAHAMPAHPVPIWLGARGPHMIRLAARTCDGVFLSGCTPSDITRILGQLDEADTSSGPTPSVGRALYHSASGSGTNDSNTDDSVSPWTRIESDLIALASGRNLTSLGINLVDLAQPDDSTAASILVQRAAPIVRAAARELSTP